ncbi:MAG: hypothetical protein AB7F19_07565 [Candidatus Babeliales bacterium]
MNFLKSWLLSYHKIFSAPSVEEINAAKKQKALDDIASAKHQIHTANYSLHDAQARLNACEEWEAIQQKEFHYV